MIPRLSWAMDKLLIAHLDGPQTINTHDQQRQTRLFSLLRRGFIRRDFRDTSHTTILTAEGRLYLPISLARVADELSANEAIAS